MVVQRSARAFGAWGLATAVGLGMCFAPPVLAEATQFTCPVRLQPQGARLIQGAAGGFSPAFQPGTVSYLLGVSVFDGAPADGNELAPDSASATQLQWHLEGQRRAHVVCRYEGGIGLSRPVDARARMCTATLRRSDGKSGIEAWGLERAAVACV